MAKIPLPKAPKKKRKKPVAYPSFMPVKDQKLSILHLDLGRRTGWFLLKPDGTYKSGVHELYSETAYTHPYEDGARFFALLKFISQIADSQGGLSAIVFEEVHPATSKGRQATLYPGMRGLTMGYAHEHGIPCYPIPTGSWKLVFTGNGSAKKEVVFAEAVKRGHLPYDDNESDAIGIAAAFQEIMSSESAKELAKGAVTAIQIPEPKKKRTKGIALAPTPAWRSEVTFIPQAKETV